MFRLDWLQSALDELTNIWLAADAGVRQSITKATHEVEQRLLSDPINEGESRAKRQRITFADPLAVTFQVEADGRTVTVLHVRLFRPRRS